MFWYCMHQYFLCKNRHIVNVYFKINFSAEILLTFFKILCFGTVHVQLKYKFHNFKFVKIFQTNLVYGISMIDDGSLMYLFSCILV